ncbi:MAG: helix-turn-helix domain-containing protein [Trebonia sp.]
MSVTRLSADRDVLGFDRYRAAVCQAVVPLNIRSERPERFRGFLGTGSMGDIHVLDISAGAHAVNRTPALIARAPQRYLKFTVVENGTGMVAQDGRETALRVGEMTVYDTSRPYTLLFDGQTRLSVVMFPHELLDIPAELLDQVTATRLRDGTGVGETARACISSVARQIPGLRGTIARHLFRSAIEMAAAVLESSLGTAVAADARATFLRRILGYIDDNLSSPELSPAQIAAAHFVSVRYLHGLFSSQGTTVSTVIRTRRLERCYDVLASPGETGRSVAAIARGSGFTDAAHFSRTFRAHFGVLPSAIRPS